MTFTPQGKLFFASNNTLPVDGGDDAFFRRVQVIPFPVKLPERDYQAGFADEIEGILAWAVQGVTWWYQDGKAKAGLVIPERITQIVAQYKEVMDPLEEFIEGYLEEDPEGFISSHELFGLYKRWCMREDQKPMYKQQGLTKTIKDRGYEYGRPYIDGERERGLLGLKAKPESGYPRKAGQFGVGRVR